jgi:glutaredoxin-like YruB-family protein
VGSKNPKFMVKIYSTPACPYCFTLKEFLKEKGIEFEEIDVSKDEKARDEMIKKSGKLEAPVIDIDGQIVVGFDKEKIVKLLNIKE